MVGFSQQQHFFAAGCIFADFAIALIFYPLIKTLWKSMCILFRCCNTQILNLRAQINFANILKIIRKSRLAPIFGQFLKYLQNWFLLSNLISECCNTQIICTTIFIKFLLQDKKWERLQNQQKDILQKKKVVAGKNLPYVAWGNVAMVSCHHTL